MMAILHEYDSMHAVRITSWLIPIGSKACTSFSPTSVALSARGVNGSQTPAALLILHVEVPRPSKVFASPKVDRRKCHL